jgi:hypothetical protein
VFFKVESGIQRGFFWLFFLWPCEGASSHRMHDEREGKRRWWQVQEKETLLFWGWLVNQFGRL